jgi:hypothetical protein
MNSKMIAYMLFDYRVLSNFILVGFANTDQQYRWYLPRKPTINIALIPTRVVDRYIISIICLPIYLDIFLYARWFRIPSLKEYHIILEKDYTKNVS